MLQLARSQLVFGIIPRFPIILSQPPKQMEKRNTISEARMKMIIHVAEQKIRAASTMKIYRSAHHIFRLNEKALVSSKKKLEKENRSTPPTFFDERTIIVSFLDGNHKYLFDPFQLKPYFHDINFQYWNRLKKNLLFCKSVTAPPTPIWDIC